MPIQIAEVIAVEAVAGASNTTSGATSAVASRSRPDSAQLQMISLRILPLAACQACAEGRGCGAGLFSRLLSQQQQVFRLPSALRVAVGEQVMLQADERAINHMATYWYGLPLLLLLLSAGLAQYWFADQAWVDGAVLLALLAGRASGWWLARHTSANA
jgi:sigma-E factor negative regulatory protein RseC